MKKLANALVTTASTLLWMQSAAGVAAASNAGRTENVTLAAKGEPTRPAAIQEGEYRGQGQWKNQQGQDGKYLVTTTVEGAQIRSSYQYEGGQKFWEFEISGMNSGTFDIYSEGLKVGEGYCYDVQCHYSAFNGALEETLTFVRGSLYKLGSKDSREGKIIWQEELRLKK